MKHVIVGTSGHIDHGKTSLIKALTGRETDKLKEEKERGISIDLGFTFFDLPSGKRAGIIDVPGHEKFIKNMLAGATSLDVVLVVIAADEGIMPQTKEHIEILDLLGVKKSIIVLTKVDLVDSEWRKMINEEVKEYLKTTSLSESKVINFSSRTKEGLNDLIDEIDKAVEEVEEKDKEGHFRLAVDRCFSVSGFGTVVTGTILSGNVSLGDNVIINPKNIETKVRNIQIHGNSVNKGEAGERCALNLSGVSKDYITRGDIVCSKDTIIPSYMVNIKVKYLKSNDKNLNNRQRIKLYHGTSEIIGRIILLDKEELEPGEEGYAQLRLEKELCAQKGDRIVIRNYSPMITLGGGIILEPNSNKVKRFNEEYIDNLKLKEGSSLDDIVENSVLKISEIVPSVNDILKDVGRNIEEINDILDKLVKDKKILRVIVGKEEYYIHNKYFNKKTNDIYKILQEFHSKNPLKFGMSKEEIRSKVFSNKLKQKTFQEIILLMENRNMIKQEQATLSLNEFNITLTKEQERVKNNIMNEFKNGGVKPPKIQDIINKEKNLKEANNIYFMLLEQGELVKLSEDVVMDRVSLQNAKEGIINFAKKNGSINLAEAKDVLDTSRKFLVAILEYLDNNKVTKRVEDKRILY